MLATALSVFGVFLTGIGTFVRVVPDLERKTRRHFYSIAPFTRELFRIRKSVKNSPKGHRFPIDHRQVRKEFIDYIDAHDIREPPDQLPKRVTNVGAGLEIELQDGSTEYYPQGTLAQRVLVELLTRSIERTCRNNGLMIAVIGAGITIVGIIL